MRSQFKYTTANRFWNRHWGTCQR